jgi:hypothetical protein
MAAMACCTSARMAAPLNLQGFLGLKWKKNQALMIKSAPILLVRLLLSHYCLRRI